MNLLFIGDVFGSPGRAFLKERLPGLIAEYDSDLVVVNCENAAGGSGLTGPVAQELYSCGADVLTSGNHIWAKREIYPHLDSDKRIIRPLNYPPSVPGRGSGLFDSKTGRKVAVLNVCGRVFSNQQLECPFRTLDREITKYSVLTPYIFIDFHGEATSEKVAVGWYLDGRVSAILGTHTHVQTADDTILPKGTAYITDVGMTGSYQGVIGVDREIIIKHFLTQLPVRHQPAKGLRQLCGVSCTFDSSGKAKQITRIMIKE